MTWTTTTNLKFCLLNAENLFVLVDDPAKVDISNLQEQQWQRLSTSVYDNKPLHKCKDIARALLEINADIIMFCEVGGIESLNNFNKLFMNDVYSPCLIEGNSDRSIDVGFFVRKGLPFYFDLFSNKNRLINYLYPHERQSAKTGYPIKGGKITTSHRFSRDVAELRFFTTDKEKPFLITLLTHLKSRLDREGIDPNGFERRQAELKTLLEIYKELEVAFPDVPILVAGDFNGNATKVNTDTEFQVLYKDTPLLDVLEVGNIPQDQRATFYHVRSGARTDGRQIDFAFLTPLVSQLLKPGSAKVYRYKDEFGMEQGIPLSLDIKSSLPSDHYPIVFELEGLKLS